MILSMTGYGDARQLEGEHLVSAEVRTVNNRYLKITLRVPDAFAAVESRIEKLVRDAVTRGTVSLTLRVDLAGRASRYRIDHDVVAAYFEQMGSLSEELNLPPSRDIGYLLQLPGVISEHNAEEIDPDAQWPLIGQVVEEALSRLNAFRVREGESMRKELSTHCGLVRDQLQVVSEHAPHVVVQYRDRLRERVAQLLKDAEVSVSHADLIREVSIFADRCDINEEVLRLKSHLDQFEESLTEGQSAGRKLEFLCQEMFREINTIGSKSNSIDIAHAVVEMKGTVEKLREIVQNVE